MNDPDTEPDLFRLGRQHFVAFIQELAAYGMYADPEMELRRGTGMLCSYNLKDGHIYLAIPDLQAPEGKLHLLFLRSLLSCQNNDELLDLFRLLLPYVIGHELAHHLRHRYGLFTDNLWHEEQVANQLASAVVKHRLAPAARERAMSLLKRAKEGLEDRLGIQDGAADSYDSIWQAFAVGGQIEETKLEFLELTQQVFAIDPAEMLRSSGQLSEEISRRLERRESIIDEINQQYASDYVRYLYYQLGWMYLGLASPERQYVEAFARQHLHLNIPLLPLLPEETFPDKSAILACFNAYRQTLPHSEVGSRYFYKRYRALLLTRLQFVSQAQQFRKESALILQTWDGQAGETDMLAYLSHLAPDSFQSLFPHQIAGHPEMKLISSEMHLATETDRRLWRHVYLGNKDPMATNTCSRLALLDQIGVYRALPAEVMLELSHSFCRIKLARDEAIIWQGERNDDIYILIEGELGVFGADDGQETALGTVRPGEVFGEMAFFTNEPRNATVRATEASECFVLRASDMHVLAVKYPAILMQMARLLARRLAEMNVSIQLDSRATTRRSP